MGHKSSMIVRTTTIPYLLLGIVLHVGASNPYFEIPNYWSFAVREAQFVSVFFPVAWPSVGFAAVGLRFDVLKSSKLSFDVYETVPFDESSIIGGIFHATDTWNGTSMYYKVEVYSGNDLRDSSLAMEAIHQENTIIVTTEGVDSEGCGNIRTGPCATIQYAVNQAQPQKSTVYVTPGQYVGQGNVGTILSSDPVRITTTNGPQYTVINCTESNTRAFSIDPGATDKTIIEGFTIYGGLSAEGGCVYIDSASPTLLNMAFVGCQATSGVARGGALYVRGSQAKPRVSGSLFYYNRANEGGAVHATDGAMIEIVDSSIDLGVCASGTGLGGGIYALSAGVVLENSAIKNCIAAFGGGGIMLDASIATLNGVVIKNNTVANTGAGINLFGSVMTISKSSIVDNHSTVFGGGVLVTSSHLTVSDSEFDRNFAGKAGAAIKVLGGVANVTSTKISSNFASEYGAAFDITTQGLLSSEKTYVYVTASEIADNTAERGAAFFLHELHELVVSQTILRNNTASRGGAIWCRSSAPARFDDVYFHENQGREGGALYATNPCRIKITSAQFVRNGAAELGGAILAGEGAELAIKSSLFLENGWSHCDRRQTPLRGGAIVIGRKEYILEDSCSIAAAAKNATVEILDSRFVSNSAQETGGAIFMESGILNVNRTSFARNSAGISGLRGGFGGAIGIQENCLGQTCALVQSAFEDTQLNLNEAQAAGGGVYLSGQNPLSKIIVRNTNFIANRAKKDGTKGLGGGAFIDMAGTNLTYVQFANNSASLGGGIYISANFSSTNPVVTDNIFMSNNLAENGLDVYWEKLESQQLSLQLNSIISLRSNPSSIATEAMEAIFVSEIPTMVRSGSLFDPIIVHAVDYYGEVGISEFGECQVVAVPRADIQPPSIRAVGSKSPLNSGVVYFSQLQMIGEIGETYDLEIQCQVRNEDLSGILSFRDLPPVAFSVQITDCPPGYSPTESGEGDLCVQCQYGTFNLDGRQCQSCPRGASCPGGDSILSDSNWWRSDNSSLEFFQCRFPDVCKAGPNSGDEACAEGHAGPLCAVCKDGWFEFAGKCQECNKNAKSKIFITLSFLVVGIIIILLFARSWDFGDPASPGLLSKVKVLLMHFQIISLLKQYDILWPPDTSEGFSWLSLIDFGPSMIAPECLIGEDYNFWMAWIIQISLPIAALALCFGVYRIATAVLNVRRKQSLADTKFSSWLEGLKIRCYKNAYWLITLLYPSTCFLALQMFSWETLDVGTFLTTDFSIKIRNEDGGFTKTYIGYMIPGAIFLLVMALGFPLFCFLTIWRHRKSLDDPLIAKSYGFLYGSYSRKIPYWETVQMLRRFIFAFIPVFVSPNANGSLQGTIAQAIAMFLLVATVWVQPFGKSEDNYLEIASQIVINLLLLSGCATTWADVSSGGMKALASVQLLLSSFVVFFGVVLIAHGVHRLVSKWRLSRGTDEDFGKEGDPESSQSKEISEIRVHVTTDTCT